MPITIITTPGAANANSYRTVLEADAYFTTRPYSTAWASIVGASAEDTKAALLIEATRRIDERAYHGIRQSATQALAFPRYGLLDSETGHIVETIPVDVGHATCEMALALAVANADTTQVNKLAQFKSLSLPGGLKLELRDGFAALDQWPPRVERLLSRFINYNDGPLYLERG